MNDLDIFSAFDEMCYKDFFEDLQLHANPTIAFRLALEGVYYIGNDVKAIFEDIPVERIINDIVENTFPNVRQQQREPEAADGLADGDELRRVLNLKRLGGVDYFTRDENIPAMFDSIAAEGGRNPLIAVLALQAFLCITGDRLGLNDCHWAERFRDFLRKWRNSFQCTYQRSTQLVLEALGRQVFKCMEVPLFVDKYGRKKLLGNYIEIEEFEINGDTPICHVTHEREAEMIKDQGLIVANENKNCVLGVWFGLCSDHNKSVYGSRRYKTTLAELGVTGLRQGEIVKYTNENNVILYAHRDGGGFAGLQIPTDNAVSAGNLQAYVKVSIYVPGDVNDGGNRNAFVERFSDIEHEPFCLRQFRLGSACPEAPRCRKGHCFKQEIKGRCTDEARCRYRHNPY